MIRRFLLLPIVCVGPALTGCVPAPADDEPPPDPDVLMEADRAFNRDVSERGSAAWVDWFAEDGAIVQENVGEIRGKAALAAAVGFLDVPGVSLTWEPDRAELAQSGDLGWTTGRYVSIAPGPDGAETRATGVYVSIWRLEPDGAWRVVMDLGNPTDTPSG